MNICKVYREWLKNEKISSVQQFYRWKCLFTATRQRQMVRLEESCNSKSFVKINQGVHEAPLTVQQTTYWSRWDTTAAQKVCYRATLLPSVAQSTLEFNWERETEATIPTKIGPQRTNIAWSDEFRFLLLHSRGRVTIWCKQHERMNAWIHPDLYQHSGVEDSFLLYFGPLGNNRAPFKCLHEYCCWPWPWLWRMLFGFLFLSNLKTTCTCSQYNLFELYSVHLFMKLRVVREGAGAHPRIS